MDEPTISGKTLGFLREMMMALQKLLDPKEDFSSDYRIALSRAAVMVQRPIQLV